MPSVLLRIQIINQSSNRYLSVSHLKMELMKNTILSIGSQRNEGSIGRTLKSSLRMTWKLRVAFTVMKMTT